jgi:hypothetical protein
LKPYYLKLLPNVAFNFHLRRFSMVAELVNREKVSEGQRQEFLKQCYRHIKRELLHKVGRCRLTVSKPELKARLGSALESKM